MNVMVVLETHVLVVVLFCFLSSANTWLRHCRPPRERRGGNYSEARLPVRKALRRYRRYGGRKTKAVSFRKALWWRWWYDFAWGCFCAFALSIRGWIVVWIDCLDHVYISLLSYFICNNAQYDVLLFLWMLQLFLSQ